LVNYLYAIIQSPVNIDTGCEHLNREEILKSLADATLSGDSEQTALYAKKALESGVDAYDAIMEGCAMGMKIASEKYETGEMFVPEMLLAAEAMYAAIDILKPNIKLGKAAAVGTVIIGVVEGDIHDIGKNLVKIMLDATGYQIFDLGSDVPVKTMAAKAKEVNADVIAISTLMTTTMVGIKPIVDELNSLGIRARTKVIIGGAPTSLDFAKSIGVDAWSKDATAAVKEVEKLIVDARKQ
jgi:corrinoid protein of di/trimethylamine methyltransferase